MPKPITLHVTHPFMSYVNSCNMCNLITVPKSDVKDSIHFSEFAHILSNDVMTPSPSVEMDEPIPLILTQWNHMNATCMDKKTSVLLNLKHPPEINYKKLGMCLLNVRSMGDDVKSGMNRDMIETDEATID